MNSSIGIRNEQDGAAESPADLPSGAPTTAVEYDEMDAVIHNDEEAAADFLERLGDLDQFVSVPAAPVTAIGGPGAGLRNTTVSGFNADGEFVVIDQVDDAPAPEVAAATPAANGLVAEPESEEARTFLERLGDLDRFIAAAPDDEVSDFHQRLSDLDRFVGATESAASGSSLCTACHKPLDPSDTTNVHAVHLLGAIEGRHIEGLPRSFHAECWIDADGNYRRTS